MKKHILIIGIIAAIFLPTILFWPRDKGSDSEDYFTLYCQAIIKLNDDKPECEKFSARAEAERLENAKRQYEEARDEWLKENPPVDVLFDTDRQGETEYAIEYLRRNKIGGHCALVWRIDVVCYEHDGIKFPTSRE